MLTAFAALGQGEVKPPREVGSLRLEGGLLFLLGNQVDEGPGLDYRGAAPGHLGGSVRAFAGAFGGMLRIEHDGFSLVGGPSKLSGSVWRGEVGPAVRFRFGGLKLQGHVAYAWAQLPFFGSSVQPTFGHADRQAVAVGLGLRFPLFGRLEAEVRGEFPVPLSVKIGSAKAQAFGARGGVALIYPLGYSGRLRYGLSLGYGFLFEKVTSAEGAVALDRHHQVMLGLRLTLLSAPPPPRVGGLRIHLVDAKSGRPLSGAKIALGGADAQGLVTDRNGFAGVDSLTPAEVSARATLAGYFPEEGRVRILAGKQASLELRARHLPPPTGGLAVTLADKESHAPIAGASVKVHGVLLHADARGRVAVAKLPLGPLAIAASAEGYQPDQEVASIVKGQQAQVAIYLVRKAHVLPAELSGHIRSVEGPPVAAMLEILETHQTTRADAGGRFQMELPKGSYRVRISAPGFLPQTKRVTVRPDERVIFNVDLYPRHVRRHRHRHRHHRRTHRAGHR